MFNLFNKNKFISIVGPMTGNLVDITEVLDDVFSEKLVRDGIAINPIEGTITSPVTSLKTSYIKTFPLKIQIYEPTKLLLQQYQQFHA